MTTVMYAKRFKQNGEYMRATNVLYLSMITELYDHVYIK